MPTAQQREQDMHENLEQRYASVKQRIAEAATRAGRRPEEVILVAVTKFASIDEIRELINLGHRDFGENRVQNLIQRAAQIDEFLERRREMGAAAQAERVGHPPLPETVRWHMIGHLQRNKVRKVLEIARLVHSVDSLRLAEEIQTASMKFDEPIEILIQVNTSGEKSKYGIAPPATRHLIEQIETTMNLRTRGLMCMAPLTETPENARPTFERCRELYEDIKIAGVAGEHFNILSMGMTNDFEVAVECGANIVRIGSAIFGEGASSEHEEP